MDWELISADFRNCDGALCDIYVQNASLADWRAVISKLVLEWPSLAFRIGEQAIDPPNDISELLYRQPDDECPSLYVPLGSTTLNCHFFTDVEIEFDLDPREMKPALLSPLIDFLTLLGKATAKPVLLTMENMPEATIMRFDPSTGMVDYVGPAFS